MILPGIHTLKQTIQAHSQSLSPLQSKVVTLIIALALGALTFSLAPADLQPGPYKAHVKATLPGQQLSVQLPIAISPETGQPISVRETAGSYTMLVEGESSFPYKLGQEIGYRVRVFDQAGQTVLLTFNDVQSVLQGPGYEQTLPPTLRSEGGLAFSFRMPYRAKTVAALLAVVAVLWVTEVVPLAASALLIPVVIAVTGVTDVGTVLQPFFHPIIVLFLAGFLLAEAMHRTGIDRLIALAILRRASLKPAFLMLSMLAITAFFSMWMSNTASVAIIIPIALMVLDKMPLKENKTGFRRALILGVAYAATIGGIGSAIGTPANMLAITFLSEFTNTPLTFVDWFAYGLPMVLLMIPIIWLYLLFAFRVRLNQADTGLSHAMYEAELKSLGPMNRSQKLLLVVFLGIVTLWLTEGWHHIHTAMVALAGVLILFFVETIKKEDLNHINWNALLTFGGGLSIGSLLVLTGVSDWVALQLTGMVGLPPMLVVFLVAALTLTIGALISNTACAAMLIPMAIPLAQILQIDPRLLVTVVAIGSSIDFAMVIGTPPTMMAYSTGFFKTSDIFKRGIVLDLIGVLILSFGVIWIWQLLGVVMIR
jgi:sodium-dependent dicarboxylate transporter 2/3/5